MALRYMGTKKALAPCVRDVVRSLAVEGSLLDLFSGMGSVARSLVDERNVQTNDALLFLGCFARTFFVARGTVTPKDFPEMERRFRYCRSLLRTEFARLLAAEELALSSRMDLADFMAWAPHVGNDSGFRQLADEARPLGRATDFRMATLYYGGGYFGFAQAIDLDAIRYAISGLSGVRRDHATAAWLSAASRMINAPGHTAQFLKPTSDAIYRRIELWRRRDVWTIFQERLADIQPVGTVEWRRGNRTHHQDALSLLEQGSLGGVGVIYADPPYTRDQYSRFYHVYESLYRYNFPESVGEGRYPPDRFVSPFSRASQAKEAFEGLAAGCANRKLPLVLSYPANGLLSQSGHNLEALLSEHLEVHAVHERDIRHSTLGGSTGTSTKQATERIFVCRPF